jgi:lipoprotein signal peptidase
MIRNPLLASLLIFLAVITLDQSIKHWVGSLDQIVTLGLISLSPVSNSGILLGTLSNAPPLIRTITFSCLFIFILFLVMIFQVLLFQDQKFKKLNLSIGLLLGGISSNGIDRIQKGYVLDYLHFSIPGLEGIYLNLADLMLLFGAFATFFQLSHFRAELWPKDDLRTFRLIDPKFQLAFSFKIFLMSFFSMSMMGVFAFSFFKTYFFNFADSTQKQFLIAWIILTSLLSLFSFIFGLIISGRAAGPVYAITRFVRELKINQNVSFKLRKNDSFQQLEILSNEIRNLIGKS